MNGKIKKIIALGVGAGIVAAGAGYAVASYSVPQVDLSKTIAPTNTMIVLPTTPSVDGVPLHIKEDGVAGARLAVKVATMEPELIEKTVEIPVEVPVRSLDISDDNQSYILNNADFSELNLLEGVNVAIDFSKIEFDSEKKVAVLHDDAIVISVDNSSLALLDKNYTLVAYKDEDGNDILRAFTVSHVDGSVDINDEFEFKDFQLRVLDIGENEDRILARVVFDGTKKDFVALSEGTEYVAYIDGNELVITEATDTLIDELKKGDNKFITFEVNDIFIGIRGTTTVVLSATHYELEHVYKDGDNWKGLKNWVIDIDDPEDGVVPFKIIFNVDDPETDDEEVLKANDIEIPVLNLSMHTHIVTDDEGDVKDVYYYFEQVVTKTGRATIKVPNTEVVDPDELVVKDTYILEHGLPDENIIIVGGWVSNKAWQILEEKMPNIIQEVRDDVMEDGYVVKILPNPDHEGKYVIIVAGKTYVETAKAVEELMEMLDE